MPVKAGYLIAGAAGLALVWSGLRGKSWSVVLRDLLSGKNPQGAPNANALNAIPQSFNVGGGGQPVTGPVVSPAGPGQTAFFTAVLLSLGAPPTPANLHSLNAWYAHEEPTWPPFCTNNPLNTEIKFPGFSGICPTTSAVAEFATATDGIGATAGSIRQIAPDVAKALQSGKGLCGQSFAGLHAWSGGGYSSVC